MSPSRCLPLFVFLLLAALIQSSQAADLDAPVRVMSFNIRYGTANDGANHWRRRREFLAETIRAFDPDLLGTQETLGLQRDWLAEKLPGFGVLGVGRDDGRETGEMMALYYRESRYEKLEGGHFWLSETPEEVGSKSWDSSLPRMVTWVKLRDKESPAALPILFFNTHFDHLGNRARAESAKLIRTKLAELGTGCSLIVTGDFNDGDGGEPYRNLFSESEGVKSPVVDTYRVVNPDRGEMEGTFSSFLAKEQGGPRIDWIGVSRDWTVTAAAIDHTSRDGRTPSDHFPVTATLQREKPASDS
ncbi:MAG: endonuclease/exonuclease/phosphatase family protein, partial [Planctomycetota bacterium]|nr:endonuclease/exonuclease/phosphatase family protein [Planctomycetota bacterium]